MTLARFISYCCAFFLLCLLGAAFYLYRSWPAHLEGQLELLLRDYGVVNVELRQPALTRNRLQVSSTMLRGKRQGFEFNLKLNSLDVSYDWQSLRSGRVLSINIESLNVNLDNTSLLASSIQDADNSNVVQSPTDLALQEFRPRSLLSDLPFDALNIEKWKLDYLLPGEPIAANGSLNVATDLSLPFQARHLDVVWEGQFYSGSTSEFGANISAHNEVGALLDLNASLDEAGAKQWDWSATGTVHYQPLLALLQSPKIKQLLPDALSLPTGLFLRGTSQFEATLKHAAIIVLDPINPPSLPRQLRGNIAAQHQITATQPDGLLAALDIQGTTESGTPGIATLGTDIELGQNALQVRLAPSKVQATLRAAPLGLDKAMLSSLQWQEEVPFVLRNSAPATFEWNYQKNEFHLHLSSTAVKLGGKRSNIELSKLALEATIPALEPANAAAHRQLSLSSKVSLRLREQAIPALQLALTAAGPMEQTQIEASLRDTAESLSSSLEGVIDSNNGTGTLSLRARSLDLPYAASSIAPILRKLDIVTQPLPELTSGHFRFVSNIQSRGWTLDKLTQNAHLEVSGLSGTLDEYRFNGIQMNAAWSGVDEWKTTAPIHIQMQSFAAGFDVNNLSAVLRLPKPTSPSSPGVVLDSLTAEMFGGKLLLPQATSWQVGAAINKITLQAKSWELEKIVALQQGQDIKAKGLLDGELPLIVSEGRIVIENGYLLALPPGGSIAYSPNASARQLSAENEQLGVALELLEDFRFEVLKSDVALDRSGNLLFGLNLSGSNPAQYSGRKINFNINLEQNIDPLLQSLRLDDTLIKKLERRGQ